MTTRRGSAYSPNVKPPAIPMASAPPQPDWQGANDNDQEDEPVTIGQHRADMDQHSNEINELSRKVNELTNIIQSLVLKLERAESRPISGPVASGFETPQSRVSQTPQSRTSQISRLSTPASLAKANVPFDHGRQEDRTILLEFEMNGEVYEVPKGVLSGKIIHSFDGVYVRPTGKVDYIYKGPKGGCVRYAFDEFGNPAGLGYLNTSEKLLYEERKKTAPLQIKPKQLFA